MTLSRTAAPSSPSRPVDIGGEPPRAVCAEPDPAVRDWGKLRHFADLVDSTSGRASAEQNRGRTFENFDRLKVEGIAVVAAEIPHSIEVEIVPGAEAPDGEIVALHPRFAGSEADARHVTQRIARARDTLILHQLLWDHVD
jgi:hypothetical protein